MSTEKYLWVDKYRPKLLVDYVWTDVSQRQQVENWVREKHLPNILLSGGPGIGKTTLAKCLLNELNVDQSDIRYVNGSETNGVDDIRGLRRFAETMPIGDFRYVVLDECLEENTLVIVLRNGVEQYIAIKDVDQINDLVKSYNIQHSRIEWRPFKLFDKGFKDTLEIEFENGEVVICTYDHKWYVQDLETNTTLVVKAEDLYKYNHILTTL